MIVIFIFMMISFIITLNRDRIKLETRADKHKEIERRSLRIVQVKENQMMMITYNKELADSSKFYTLENLLAFKYLLFLELGNVRISVHFQWHYLSFLTIYNIA